MYEFKQVHETIRKKPQAIYTSIEYAVNAQYSLTATAHGSLFATAIIGVGIQAMAGRRDKQVLLPPAILLALAQLLLTSQLLIAQAADSVQDVFVLA